VFISHLPSGSPQLLVPRHKLKNKGYSVRGARLRGSQLSFRRGLIA